MRIGVRGSVVDRHRERVSSSGSGDSGKQRVG